MAFSQIKIIIIIITGGIGHPGSLIAKFLIKGDHSSARNVLNAEQLPGDVNIYALSFQPPIESLTAKFAFS